MFKLAIIGAMESELKKIFGLLDGKIYENKYPFKILSGMYKSIEVIIAVSGIGKVNAAACSQFLIERYNPNELFNIGVSAGCRNMKIGDVAIVKSFTQHDFNISELGYSIGYIPEIDNYKILTDEAVLRKIIDAFKTNKFKVHIGDIATGDSFVSSEQIKKIHNIFNADIFDMEAAAIAQVCFRSKLPFGSVKIISDNGYSFQYYENKTDFKYACFEVVRCYIEYNNRL